MREHGFDDGGLVQRAEPRVCPQLELCDAVGPRSANW